MDVVRLSVLARLCVVFFLFVGIGCSDDEKVPTSCDDITCERGSCDDNTGLCANPKSCEGVDECLVGFDCVDNACEALVSCESTDDCSRGVCFQSACVNPDICDDNPDCIDGYACGTSGTCVEDVCADVSCEQGVCDRNGECVNSEVCTNASEASDCLDGFVCSGQECVDEATFCGQLACERGVCDFANKACGNAAACSDDTLCVEGSYCDDSGACAANACNENNVCPRGVCNASDATCINPDTCSGETDCVDGFFCIGSSCEAIDDACAECPGNQACDYVESTLSVFCSESPSGCFATNDCLTGRICRSGACQAPPACEDDSLEPNNDLANATDWNAADKAAGLVASTICAADVDHFTFDVDSDLDFTGTLVATAVFNTEDVGLGELEVELFDPAGTSFGTMISSNGTARIETAIGNLSRGVYSATVKGSGTLVSSGIRYGMFFDVVPDATVANCVNATAIQPTNTGDTISGGSVSLGGSCVIDRDAPEDIYTFTLTEYQYVSMTLTATNGNGLTMNVRRDCEIDTSELTCLASSGTSVAYSEFLAPGAYFVVVQGETLANPGPYSLTYAAQTPVCTPGESSCSDTSTAVTCTPNGTRFESTTCSLGCDQTIGRCTAAQDDVCYSATDVSAGYAGTINLGDFNADYDPGVSCVGGNASSPTGGPDAAFAVDLAAGEALLAVAVPRGYDNISLYAVRDCDDLGRTCLAGVDAADSRESETLAYSNTTGAPQTVYVITDVSGTESTYDDIDLTITKGAIVCTPEAQQCVGAVQETCNAAGIGHDTVSCSFGCDAQTGACSPPPNDQCGAGAIDVSLGGTWTGTIDDYSADYDPTSRGCTGWGASGRDAVYQVLGNPGDIVTVNLAGSFDMSLYAVTDCSDLTTCLDGDDSGSDENIRFVLPDANPVYIIVDAFSASGTGAFTLDVLIETPDCFSPGSSLGCANATDLDWCDPYGITRQYTCNGACVAATCQTPTGDVCHDAIPLTVGNSFTGSFSDFTNTFNLRPGGCYLGLDEMDGKDAVFRVPLSAGETLDAVLTTSDASAGMYILEDCGDVDSACLWAAPRSSALEFYAPTSADYFLVVDSTYAYTTTSFTVNLTSSFGDVCQPGGASCNSTTNVLTVCNESGSAIEKTLTCGTGCNNQVCNPPTTLNDTCVDAFAIGGSTIIMDEFDSFADDYNPGSTGCTGRSETGPDHVYSFTLAPNDVVEIDLQVLGTNVDPSAYLVTDCTTVSTSCIWGTASSNAAFVDGYLNDTGVPQSLYLIVDSDSAYDDEPYILDIDIKPFECTLGTEICLDLDTRSSCTDYGVFADESCHFGCTAGTCNTPPNELCIGAIPVGTGGNFSAPIELFSNDYDPGSNGCTGSTAPGPDATYALDAIQGDVISVTLTGPFDGAVYAVTDCGNLTGTCVAGDDAPSGQDAIRFIAPTTDTYYIIVDSFSTTPSGVFNVDISVDTPICTPGAAVCLDPSTLQVCDSYGLVYNDHTCSTSCAGTSCTAPNGDTCFEAVDTTTTQTFTGVSIDTFTNDYNPGSAGCTGYGEPGPDTAYALAVVVGEVVTATLDPTFDGALYAVTACDDLDTCLDGSDSIGTEDLQFVAPYTGTIFIIVDAFSATATGTFDLTISSQAPICVPASTSCADANTLETCDALGLSTSQVSCGFGCAAGACNTPPNDECSGAIDASAGGTFSGSFAEAANDYSPDDLGTCTTYEASGPDLTYFVSLTAGQVVTATLTATDFDQDTSLYIVSDCAGDIEANCLVGEDTYDVVNGNGTGESVTYTATGTETVFIVADNFEFSLVPTPTFDLVITVQ